MVTTSTFNFPDKGEKVQLIVVSETSRYGRNPQTGKEIEIPASKVPAFKVKH